MGSIHGVRRNVSDPRCRHSRITLSVIPYMYVLFFALTSSFRIRDLEERDVSVSDPADEPCLVVFFCLRGSSPSSSSGNRAWQTLEITDMAGSEKSQDMRVRTLTPVTKWAFAMTLVTGSPNPIDSMDYRMSWEFVGSAACFQAVFFFFFSVLF